MEVEKALEVGCQLLFVERRGCCRWFIEEGEECEFQCEDIDVGSDRVMGWRSCHGIAQLIEFFG